MLTKKDLFKMMNGKKVLKEAINCFTVEDNENLKQSIIESLEANGKTLADFQEDENTYSVKGFSTYWRKSKLKKYERGILEVRSKDYMFINASGEKCYGEIPKKENLVILENGFISLRGKDNNGDYIGMKYTIIEE